MPLIFRTEFKARISAAKDIVLSDGHVNKLPGLIFAKVGEQCLTKHLSR